MTSVPADVYLKAQRSQSILLHLGTFMTWPIRGADASVALMEVPTNLCMYPPGHEMGADCYKVIRA